MVSDGDEGVERQVLQQQRLTLVITGTETNGFQKWVRWSGCPRNW